MTQELWKGNVINNCACQYGLLPWLCITSGCLHPLAVYILWLCLSSGCVYPLAVYKLCLCIHYDSRTMEGECDNQLRMSVRTPSMWPSLVRWVPPEKLWGGDIALQGNLHQRVRGVFQQLNSLLVNPAKSLIHFHFSRLRSLRIFRPCLSSEEYEYVPLSQKCAPLSEGPLRLECFAYWFYSLADHTLLAFGNPLMDNRLGCSHFWRYTDHRLPASTLTDRIQQHLVLMSYRSTKVVQKS